MTLSRRHPALLLALLAALPTTLPVTRALAADPPLPAASAPRAALTVTAVQPQTLALPVRISANGNIAAWQEASVGTEANGLRLAEVRVNVGDVVKRGQVLATFAPDTIQAELAQTRAAVAEAEAALAAAAADAQRARDLQPSGALSSQQIQQYLTAENTAKARLDAQRASARQQQLRLRQTQVLAPDAGVISARSATVGAVLPAGQELFRLIRQGRLEWRGEVAATDLASIQPGMAASVTPAGGPAVLGKVRQLAPMVDPSTRNGVVYVDLPAPGTARAGMFARGEFQISTASGLTLPQAAVVQRDGFSYVLRIEPGLKLRSIKVEIGRRMGDRIEITKGLDASARVVASGAAFLADGDTVRVVEAAPATAPANTSAATPARPTAAAAAVPTAPAAK